MPRQSFCIQRSGNMHVVARWLSFSSTLWCTWPFLSSDITLSANLVLETSVMSHILLLRFASTRFFRSQCYITDIHLGRTILFFIRFILSGTIVVAFWFLYSNNDYMKSPSASGYITLKHRLTCNQKGKPTSSVVINRWVSAWETVKCYAWYSFGDQVSFDTWLTRPKISSQ